MSLSSSLAGKPSAKMPQLMRARAAGVLPRQGSLDLPPKDTASAMAAVPRSGSSPDVVRSTNPISAPAGPVPGPAPAVPAPASTEAPTGAAQTPAAEPDRPANAASAPSPRTPRQLPKVTPPVQFVAATEQPTSLTASGKGIAAVIASSSEPAAPPLTASGKNIAAAPKPMSAKSKAIEDTATAVAELHSLAIDPARVRPFLEQLDKNTGFREKMTGELKKGAELKRVGEKGALSKVHLRVSDGTPPFARSASQCGVYVHGMCGLQYV